eukprot:TRINITY_DN8305_c0_g1_i1.p1 TRINITY_DN8305_c0_g1~~TRINITY_DN8305_c0_g1_i1.p1  ORF type:complete len:275 (-),score=49.66 TRINITY_DN8305_c0_g1_i1:36-860(-)
MEDIKAWQVERNNSCKDPNGWLTLVGLHWLEEGSFSVGSGSSNGIVFDTKNCPEKIGDLTVAGGKVTFKAHEGVEVTHDGKSVTTIEMKSDNDSTDTPTNLVVGSVSFFVILRNGKLAIRVKDSNNPTRLEFTSNKFYPINLEYRLKGRWVPYSPPKSCSIVSVTGDAKDEPVPGKIEFDIGGETLALDVTGNPATKLFVVFSDSTSGKETYGGGRFLYVDGPGDNTDVIIDFNKSYNPPCIFTPYATCPRPMPQNRLQVPIPVGELNYHQHHH